MQNSVVEYITKNVQRQSIWKMSPPIYLVARSETVHGADLLRGQRLAEQIDGGHLAAEHALLVHLGRCAHVAFVKRLRNGSI